MRTLLGLLIVSILPAACADRDFNGRWDIKVLDESRDRAWWLEVSNAGTPDIKGRFVGAPGGNMDDIPEITVRDGELVFVFVRQFRYGPGEEQKGRGIWRARLAGGKLDGSFAVEGQNDQPLKWVGVRAPVIEDRDDGSWKEGKAVALFNGKDLSGWRTMIRNRPLGWTVKDGAMTNEPRGNNLVSDKKFWNFKLHVECRVAAKSNSGIGLRGRYEVQVLDDYGRTPNTHTNGALYSRIVPAFNASKPAGEWQTYDITLIGRQVTIVLNGKTIIEKGEVEGLTAMGHDPNEGEPGPISLQGDHGPVEFRSIVVTPLTR